MAQVIEHFLRAIHSQNVVDVLLCVEKSLMTPGCLFLHGQKTLPFQEQEKPNMKSTFLGNINDQMSELIFLNLVTVCSS